MKPPWIFPLGMALAFMTITVLQLTALKATTVPWQLASNGFLAGVYFMWLVAALDGWRE